MPKGKPGSGEGKQPRRFYVRQVDRQWAVLQGKRWRFCDDLTIQVTVCTSEVINMGQVLAGVGVVRTLQRGAIVITA